MAGLQVWRPISIRDPIIDEVPAVATPFQQKCPAMGDAARQGRTILFVSHNMAAVRSPCRRVLPLEVDASPWTATWTRASPGIAHTTELGANQVDVGAIHRRHGYGGLQFQRLTLEAADNQAVVNVGGRIDLQMEVRVETAVNDVELSVVVDTAEGVRVCECPSSQTIGRITRLEPGVYRLTCRIDQNILNPGRYVLAVIAKGGQRVFDWVPDVMAFEVA